jgi:hypothetical protein
MFLNASITSSKNGIADQLTNESSNIHANRFLKAAGCQYAIIAPWQGLR